MRRFKSCLRGYIAGCFLFALAGLGAGAQSSLDPALPPGRNFDLSHWKLQLPILSSQDPAGMKSLHVGVDEISSSNLTTYTSTYFYTDTDGAMRFYAPITGDTTSGSEYPRSELRENYTSSQADWYDTYGTAILNATLKVNQVPSTGKVDIGQIHGDVTSNVMTILQYDKGTIRANINFQPSVDSQVSLPFSSVGLPPSGTINYQLKMVPGAVFVTVNGSTQAMVIDQSAATGWPGYPLYFKAGDYCQGNPSTEGANPPAGDGASVSFYSLGVSHLASSLQVATSSLPGAARGVPYSQTLTAANASGTATWALVSGVIGLPGGGSRPIGALPPGLTLGSNGVIGGTPDPSAVKSSYDDIVVQVTDAAGATAIQVLSIPMAAATGGALSSIFSDTFTDGERATQRLPDSVAWYYSSSPATNLAVRNGGLDMVVANNSREFWAYFPMVSLQVGESLTFSFDFTTTAPVAGGARLALAYTNGVAPVTADSSGGPSGNYQGYGAFGTSANAKVDLLKRSGPAASGATSTLINSTGSGTTAIWQTLPGGNTAEVAAFSASTPYTGTITIQRTGDDTVAVSSSFTGGALAGTNAGTASDPGGTFTRFDTVVLDFNTNSLNGDIIVTRATLTATRLPAITDAPASVAATPGGNATFTVTATGNPVPTFQWQRKAAGEADWSNLAEGGAYSGVTTATLTVSGVTAGMAGDQFRVLVSNTVSGAFSDPATLSLSTARLINLSVLTSVTADASQFTVGTVLGGAGTSSPGKPLLVRAVGPSLIPFGVGGVLVDPMLTVLSGSSVVAANDNWGGTAALSATLGQVGAFPFLDAASKDAAVVYNANVTAPPASYTVQVGGTGGAAGMVLAELYDATPSDAFTATTPRLINVSLLKPIASGEVLTVGFVVGGSPSKKVLVRAIGPTLAATFNIAGAMPDPRLDLYSGPGVIASNDNWGGDATLVAANAAVGAFAPASATSKDAELFATLLPGSYTVQVRGVGGASGLTLVEVYEVP